MRESEQAAPVAPTSYMVPHVRLSLVRDGDVALLRQVRGAVALAPFVRAWIGDADREHFVAIALDVKNRLIAANLVSIGALTASLVHPREVFKFAVLANAAALIVAHNHPSGDPTPSEDDRNLTQRLKVCGEMMGIPLVDHVVVGAGDSYRSFQEAGLL